MTDTPIQNVSDTAIWVATFRALETERPDALFRDPLADRLVGKRGREIARKMKDSAAVGWSVVIRTCMIDRYIRAAIEQGVDTILNLGAGLDTRPYRMDLPASLRWIEVDYPHLIELKEERLRGETPRCALERVKLDLSQMSARRQLFAEIGARANKALVLTEGVVPYLSEDETAALADDLRAQPAFRLWIVDYYSQDFMTHYLRRRKTQSQMRHAPFKFRPADWVEFFEGHGWKIRELRFTTEEGEALGRPFMPWWWRILRHFVPRSAQERYRKFFGYALLEPR